MSPVVPAKSRVDRSARAFSLVEAIMSLAIVSVLFVATLNLVGSSQYSQYKTRDRQRGHHLAQNLMAEILQQSYIDPDETPPPTFGRESTEPINNSRSTFDDVDDYHGWSSSPPEDREGTAIPGFEGWERRVEVQWVVPMNTVIVVGSESGAKRITVTVLHNDVPVTSLLAVRTRAWQTPLD